MNIKSFVGIFSGMPPLRLLLPSVLLSLFLVLFAAFSLVFSSPVLAAEGTHLIADGVSSDSNGVKYDSTLIYYIPSVSSSISNNCSLLIFEPPLNRFSTHASFDDCKNYYLATGGWAFTDVVSYAGSGSDSGSNFFPSVFLLIWPDITGFLLFSLLLIGFTFAIPAG